MGEIRTTVWCMGNPLRGDDGAAVRCGEMLLEKPEAHLEVILCETVPENFAAPLRRNPPERLVILDACFMGSEPGTIRLLDFECLNGLTETTHGMPLGEILKDILPADKIFVIGIEPRSTDFSLALSPEVEAAVQRLARALKDGSWIHTPRSPFRA